MCLLTALCKPLRDNHRMLLTIGLPLALILIMFALGLGLTVSDFKRIAKFPKAFAVGALSQFMLIPTIAFCVAVTFKMPPEFALGFVILGLCPGGPTSNIFTLLARGDVALSVSLTAVFSLVCVVSIPLFLPLAAAFFLDVEATNINIAGLSIAMFSITIVPVVAGVVLRRQLKNPDRAEKAMTRVATVLTVVVILGAILTNYQLVLENIATLGLAISVLIVSLMAAGALCSKIFRLETAQETAVTIGTGIQNGALGIAVGAIIAGSGDSIPPHSIPAGLYGIMMYFVCLPYVLARRQTAVVH
ncbi:MAG: bile acid:sodium symporter family protein [Pseudomonadota bacterium]